MLKDMQKEIVYLKKYMEFQVILLSILGVYSLFAGIFDILDVILALGMIIISLTIGYYAYNIWKC